MIKKLFAVAILASAMLACNNAPKENKTETETTKEAVVEATAVNPDEFLLVAADLVNKPVTTKGTVVHVCSHGGKRLFIVGDSTQQRVKVTTGPDMQSFNTEWEGSEIFVEGTLFEQVIDEQYLNDWEAEAREDATKAEKEVAHQHKEGDDHDHGHDDDLESTLKKIEDMRAEIKASGSDHLSFYSIKATKVEVK
jgi:hypothetical protein